MSVLARAAGLLCLALSTGQAASQTLAAEAPARHACDLINQTDAERVLGETARKLVEEPIEENLRIGLWDNMSSWCRFGPAAEGAPRVLLMLGYAPFGLPPDVARIRYREPGLRYELLDLPRAEGIWTFEIANNLSQLEVFTDTVHLSVFVLGLADEQATLAWARAIAERALAKL
jgi:hypothetical protein